MKRTQIQLEEEVFEVLRRRAYQENRSIASVIRDILKKETGISKRAPSSSVDRFRFVAAGRSKQGHRKPVSERHDEALVAAFKK